jgi:hypothetical protein
MELVEHGAMREERDVMAVDAPTVSGRTGHLEEQMGRDVPGAAEEQRQKKPSDDDEEGR